MERGAISQLNADRSTGRLVRLRYGSAEISFNARDVPDGGFEQLQVGQLVDFDLVTDLRRGLRALNVRAVDDGNVLPGPVARASVPQQDSGLGRAISSARAVQRPGPEPR
jgi:cold shock CspA family protein